MNAVLCLYRGFGPGKVGGGYGAHLETSGTATRVFGSGFED
jgi:hypothetical protein